MKLPAWLKIFGIIILVNLLLLDIFFIISLVRKKPDLKPLVGEEITDSSESIPALSQNTCPEACLAEIEQALAESLATVETTSREILYTPLVPTPQSQAKAVYIPLVTSASTVKMDWTDIVPSDFYFDLTDYPGAKSVRFQAYLKALHGAGRVYVHLYDDTNKRAVDYSDLSTQSPNYELLTSSPLAIWRGNNLYRVQLRSINGTEVFLQEARLKVLF